VEAIRAGPRAVRCGNGQGDEELPVGDAPPDPPDADPPDADPPDADPPDEDPPEEGESPVPPVEDLPPDADGFSWLVGGGGSPVDDGASLVDGAAVDGGGGAAVAGWPAPAAPVSGAMLGAPAASGADGGGAGCSVVSDG
jgi:hypothetical protein